MKVYGIKDPQVQSQMEVVDVVDTLPLFSWQPQGKIVFQRNKGLMIFLDNEWQYALIQDINLDEKPKSFEFNGILWDISSNGKNAILESAQRINLLTLKGLSSNQPVILKNANGENVIVSDQEVLDLALALLNHLNSNRR